MERFSSLSQEGKLLSLSFWRDEEAVRNWRQHLSHREAQEAGRAGIFADYRLRVAEVVRDYGLHQRESAPARDWGIAKHGIRGMSEAIFVAPPVR